MAITFDPAARRIILDSASVTAQQIWSRWADWVASGDNGKYLPAMSHVGGNALGGGLLIPHYFFLLNGWRVRPMEANHSLTIEGNLFVDEGGSPIVNTLGAFNVHTKLVVPVQAQGYSTGSGSGSITQAQITAIASAVWGQQIEAGSTAEQLLRVILAVLSGRTIGIGTNHEQYLSTDGTVARLVADFDSLGNRTQVTLNGS